MLETYTITKQEVLQALLTEPLDPGVFFQSFSGQDDGAGCKVCAVGAVLRQIRAGYFDDQDAQFACEERYFMGQVPASNNFLSLLSIEFEEAGDYLFYGSSEVASEQEAEDILRAHIYGVALAACPPVLTIKLKPRDRERERAAIRRQYSQFGSF